MTKKPRKTVLRLDDVGASSKIYNQHGKVYWKMLGKELPIAFFANWLFFKRIKPFSRWGQYPELGLEQWEGIYSLLREFGARLTVGVTACWAVSEDVLIPFDEKFPEEAAILRDGVQEGLLEIANHGLCHCVLDNNLFHPHAFSSNRRYHREFWDWLPESVHREHIERSQEILTRVFRYDIVTFIPPGNVWTEVTERCAKKVGLRYLSSLEEKAPTGESRNGLIYVGNDNMIDFHDREISLWGVEWLRERMKRDGVSYCAVRDYFE